MNDMTSFIAPKSDRLTADDLLAGEITITITNVSVTPGAENPCCVSFDGDGGKPWYPCKSMGRVLVKAWGPDAAQYIGKSLLLYRDPEVTWAGMKVGGIRIRALSHIDAKFDMALTETRGKKAMARFLPLRVEQQRDPTVDAFADKVLSAIARAPDLDKLNSYIAGQQAKIDRLPDDLRGKVQHELDARRDTLDDPFTGPADDQRGESFTADKPALRKAIDAATDARSLEDALADVVAADLGDEDRVELEHAVRMKREALAVGAEA